MTGAGRTARARRPRARQTGLYLPSPASMDPTWLPDDARLSVRERRELASARFRAKRLGAKAEPGGKYDRVRAQKRARLEAEAPVPSKEARTASQRRAGRTRIHRPNMTKVRAAARRHGIDPACVRPSTREGKKLMVCDPKTGRFVHCGSTAYADFTTHGDKRRRANYLKRSGGIPHKRMSPNWLARKLLW